MALRGRKPKSIAEKRLTGTLRKHPVTPAVPEPPGGDLPCPLEVEKNPRAAAYWGMYLGATAPGHLAPLDAPLLARLCMALAYADEATAQVQAVGLLVKAPNTKLPIQSPWLAIVNRQTEIARKLAAELALPPAQRSRAGMSAPRGATLPDDEWSI
jgi:phage terminase small subunit